MGKDDSLSLATDDIVNSLNQLKEINANTDVAPDWISDISIWMRKTSEIMAKQADNFAKASDQLQSLIVTKSDKIEAPAIIIHGRNRKADDVIKDLNKAITVVSHHDTAATWRTVISPDIQIPYDEKILREAVDANKNGEQWLLGYYSGQSLLQMFKMRHNNIGKKDWKRPCFDGDVWWRNKKQNFWANRTDIKPGYYLVNLNIQGMGQTWQAQEKLISDMGDDYERCHEFALCELTLTAFHMSIGEFMTDWCYWGKEIDSDGDRIFFGHFDSDGAYVNSRSDDYSAPILGAVLSMKLPKY